MMLKNTLKKNGKKVKERQSNLTELDNLSLDLIALDGLPFSVQEGAAFKKFIKIVSPQTKLLNRQCLLKLLKKQVNEKVLPGITNELMHLNPGELHLSTDIWKTKNGGGILALRGHYCLSCGVFTKTLSVQRFSEHHTSENVRHSVESVLKSFGVSYEKVGTITTDGACNMLEEIKESAYETSSEFQRTETTSSPESNVISTDEDETESDSEEDDEEVKCTDLDKVYSAKLPIKTHQIHPLESQKISCFAHSLQLVIQDAFNADREAKEVISYVQRVVHLFHKSPYWRNRLLTMTTKSFTLPVITRWSSYYHVVRQFCEETMYKSATFLVSEARRVNRRLLSIPDLSPDITKCQLDEILNILSVLCAAIDQLEVESLTAPMIVFQVTSCFNRIARLQINYFPLFQLEILQGLKARFENKLKEKYVILPAILDPRQKLTVFQRPMAEHYSGVSLQISSPDEAKSMLKREIQRYLPISTVNVETKPNLNNLDMFDELDELDNSHHVNELGEAERYLLLPREKRETDPLLFWRDNSEMFPILSHIAKIYLSIPASTGTINRVFSISKSIEQCRRAKICTKSLERLLLYQEYRFNALQH
ncbi:hypothetical protein CHUAL_014159 [Chamberlinius hualienensis]